MIQETKMKKEILEKIKFSNNMNGEASDSKSASGGLLNLYNIKKFKINTLYNDGNILFYMVFHTYSNESSFLLNVYAPNSKRERKNYWNKVGELM